MSSLLPDYTTNPTSLLSLFEESLTPASSLIGAGGVQERGAAERDGLLRCVLAAE